MRVTADFNTEIFAVTMIYREGGKIRINYKKFFPLFFLTVPLCVEKFLTIYSFNQFQQEDLKKKREKLPKRVNGTLPRR